MPSQKPESEDRGRLLSLRAAFVLGAGLLAAVAGGVLTLMMKAPPPQAALAAGSSFLAVVVALDKLID